YPSPALYAAAIVDAPGERRNALDQFLKARLASECGGAVLAVAATWPKRRAGDVSLQFVIGATAEDAAGRSTTSDGRPVPLFRELSAWTLVKVSGNQAEPAGLTEEAPFKRRIVIIGVTHADSRDIYATPLGSQPGVMILANA